jgi:hypothetical protein
MEFEPHIDTQEECENRHQNHSLILSGIRGIHIPPHNELSGEEQKAFETCSRLPIIPFLEIKYICMTNFSEFYYLALDQFLRQLVKSSYMLCDIS